ncbi:MAG: NUDIX hydrolase [Candidatus Nanopelagicales bacterium]
MSDWRDELRALAADAAALRFAAHVPPEDFGGRESAVLIAFAEVNGELDLLLIERAHDLSQHSGQPAFPGGAVEDSDADAAATALREAQEETGLNPDDVTVLAQLPRLFLPVSGFAVTPVLAHWHHPGPVHAADPREVAAVVRVPVRELVDPANRVMVRHPRGGRGPGFLVAGLTVWGFTAAIISGLLSGLSWDKPWDQTRTIELAT